MLIDAHAHLNFKAYEKDADEIIKKSLDNNVWMINVGTNLKTSQCAALLAKKHKEGVYAAIGLHPINLDTGLIKIKKDETEGGHFETEFDFEKYKMLAQCPKVVAVGEIGLDYWRRPKSKKKRQEFKQKQKELFLKEVKLAQKLNLPIILHCRLAFDDLLEILKKIKTRHRGVLHCFTGDWKQAREFMDLGFYIGFNGIIFKLDLNKVIEKTPLDKILIETDCPFLTPPKFGESRNEPIYVKEVVKKIAQIKKIDLKKVEDATTKNAKDLFKI